MTSVSSSFIDQIGWDDETKTGRVVYGNGKIFDCADIPESVIREWIAAPSAGKFWHAEIKKQYNWSEA